MATHPLGLQDAPIRLVPGLAGAWRPGRFRVGLLAVEACVVTAIGLGAGRATPLAAAVVVLFLGLLSSVHRTPLPLQLSVRAEMAPMIAVAVASTGAVAVANLWVAIPPLMWFLPALIVGGIAAARAAGYATARWARRTGRLVERVIVVGQPGAVAEIVETIRLHPEVGLVTGGMSRIDLTAPQPLVTVDVLDLSRQLSTGVMQRVIVAAGAGLVTDRTLTDVLDVSRSQAVATYVAVPAGRRWPNPPAQDRIADVQLQRLTRRRRTSMRLKRPFDVATSLTLLVALAPLLGLVALAVRLSSRGPVLYRQKRLGQRGRVIDVFKFRTFPADAVADDEEQWIEEAGGWTVRALESPLPFGRWLRRTSLDELPQLWNVLRGEMSLIGPRPERPHVAEALAEMVDGYMDRHRFPVGLTGLAQVNGLWGSTSIERRVVFDNYYIEHWSLSQDFRILARTIPEVLRRARAR